jgi:hypothetical protein
MTHGRRSSKKEDSKIARHERSDRKMKARIQDLRNALLSVMLSSAESAVRKIATDAFRLDWQKDSDL